MADNVRVSAGELESMAVDNTSTNANAAATTAVANGDVEETDPSQRWKSLEILLRRESPFGAETGQLAVGEFEPFEDVSSRMPVCCSTERTTRWSIVVFARTLDH